MPDHKAVADSERRETVNNVVRQQEEQRRAVEALRERQKAEQPAPTLEGSEEIEVPLDELAEEKESA
jgi:hypothetical protein